MADPRSAAAFQRAVTQVRAVSFRADLAVREIPAPTGLAPDAVALAADVRPGDDGESAYGTGRFVLLHDPAAPEGWEGPWRIVTFAQAPLEPDIAGDGMLADVAWSWLMDALDAYAADHTAAAGTATKTLSRGFGSLSTEDDGAQIELRASWSPRGPMGPHVQAWAELVCMLAGLPPGSEGIEVFTAHRAARG